MKFEIRNLGAINYACLDIGKINLVSGENKIEKSILSKILYCFLAPSSKDYENITEYRVYLELLQILIHYKCIEDREINECYDCLYDDENKKCLDLFRKIIEEDKDTDQEYYLTKIDQIEKIFEETEIEQYYNNLKFLLKSEYCYPKGLLKNSSIKFYQNMKERLLEKNGNIVKGLDDYNLENVFYLTTNQNEKYYHNAQIRKKRYWNYYLTENEDILKIIEKIEEIIYYCEKYDFPSGLKQLNNIKSLLIGEDIVKNSFLIIENPETDMPPKYQVKLAEILVLIALKLDIMLYINSNSQFILKAIELYSKFYNIYDNTNFYSLEDDIHSNKYNLKQINNKSDLELYSEYEDAVKMIKDIQNKIELN